MVASPLTVTMTEPDDHPRIVIFTARIGDVEVGSLSVWPGRRRNSPVRVKKIFVDPDYRRQGIASQLYDEIGRAFSQSRIINGYLTNNGKAWWAGYRAKRFAHP